QGRRPPCHDGARRACGPHLDQLPRRAGLLVMIPLPSRVAVAGGGAMGAGIATALALARVPTTVVVRREAAIEETRARIAAPLEAQRALGLTHHRGSPGAMPPIRVTRPPDSQPR